ncbi:helix-turn-helix transcriptional regulator [Streptomyces sp. NPDC047718]|uniref:helix-turn-helix domain-containing protein n=1 Tax=Streptomyces sp. NPDC047718 TaxID=3155479 RepID=UPI0033E60394
MGRPEKPINSENKALRTLAEWLRTQRRRTGQPYRALASKTGVHATTLQRAASGESVPKLRVVLLYARACNAPADAAEALWKEARYVGARARRGRSPLHNFSPPALIRDFADLSTQLLHLYERAGSPTLREMEQRAGGFGLLPRSTAHRIVHRRAVPHSAAQFRAFLRACQVPETAYPAWDEAWGRAWRHEKRDTLEAGFFQLPGSRGFVSKYFVLANRLAGRPDLDGWPSFPEVPTQPSPNHAARNRIPRRRADHTRPVQLSLLPGLYPDESFTDSLAGFTT